MNRIFQSIQGAVWQWQISDKGALHPWAEHPETWDIVKKNSVRTVFRVRDTAGNSYHVKYSHPKGILSRFFPKLKTEFKWAGILKSLGISCPEAIGWGHCGNQEMLMTATAETTVTALQYWYETASLSPESRRAFLENLSAIVRRLWQAGLWHADFHLGNVLCDKATGAMRLIDLAAIHHRRWYQSPRRLAILILEKLLLRSNADETDEECSFIQACGFAESPDDARALHEATRKSRERLRARKRPARIRKILNGDYPGCQKIVTDTGDIVYQRLTPWGTPVPKSDIPSDSITLPHDQATALWIDSILETPYSAISRIPAEWHPAANSGKSDTIIYSGKTTH